MAPKQTRQQFVASMWLRRSRLKKVRHILYFALMFIASASSVVFGLQLTSGGGWTAMTFVAFTSPLVVVAVIITTYVKQLEAEAAIDRLSDVRPDTGPLHVVIRSTSALRDSAKRRQRPIHRTTTL